MKLKIHSNLLFRVPQFPTNANLKDRWPELKESISLASTDFYNLIKNFEYEDIQHQSSAIKFTIQKYFNRARFRATPYGTFSGYGIIDYHDDKGGNIIIDPTPIQKCFSDWTYITESATGWEIQPFDNLLFFTNTSFYKIGNQIRYIYRGEDHFELSDIPYDHLVWTILQLCQEPHSFNQVTDSITEKQINKDELKKILLDLIEVQLLYTQWHPNTIGKDYFTRIGRRIGATEKTYNITQYNSIQGAFYHPALKELLELIPILAGMNTSPQVSEHLQLFIKEFQKRYDQQEVPLMIAIDPEYGLGYGGMESESDNSELVKSIIQNKTINFGMQKTDGDFPLKKEILSYRDHPVIHLEDLKLPSGNKSALLPNTFCILLSTAENLLLVDSVGGSSANALMGRFTLSDNTVLDSCKKLSEIEQLANPHVLFVDISYSGEPTVDNVNRRQAIYDYQINLLNIGTDAQVISLSDVFLTVSNGELILFSKQYKKRLIPRFASAYNTTRSDLSVFRLLCDVQNQNVHTAYIPDFKSMLPELSMIPRLQYKQIIIAPASWLLNYDPLFNEPALFKNYLDELKLPRYVKAGHGDQTLRIDLEKQEDRQLLLSILKRVKTLWVSEEIISKDYAVKDCFGNSYVSEFLLPVFHNDKVYSPYEIKIDHTEKATQRAFPPLVDWLYFEIYCKPSCMDDILKTEVAEFITNHHQEIACWFFIRYDAPGDHIRLRIKYKNKSDREKLLDSIGQLFHPLLDSGLMSDLKLCTYTRELERYGFALIDLIEEHFQIDSKIILNGLKNNLPENSRYRKVIQLMNEVASAVFDQVIFQSILDKQVTEHNKEHAMNGALFKKLNECYKEMDYGNNMLKSGIDDVQQNELKTSFIKIISVEREEKKISLFISLFHMHINRAFSNHQRVHELICYNYLLKHYKKHKAYEASAN